MNGTPRSLDLMVKSVATQLMAATATTSVEVSQRVLADLVTYLGVDVSFLRYNDHKIRASRLIAEWPIRPNIPDPDPLEIVYFADADPVFAVSENAKKPVVLRPEPATDDYQRRIEESRAVPATSMAAAPLLSGNVTPSGSSSSATGSGAPTNSTHWRRSRRCSPRFRPGCWPKSGFVTLPNTMT